MTYQEAIDFMIQSYTRGKKQGFEAMRAVLAEMGEPQRNLRVIHVAGTNGKGSVCAMLTSVLMAAGYTVGTFTSPHLERFNERIALNGGAIADAAFAAHIARVEAAVRVVLSEGVQLSYFELLLAAAFSFFASEQADIVILEAGIGGRLDATNLLPECLLAVITSVGLDHMDMLGSTIEEITEEKGGIIKKNCPVVLYSAEDRVYNRICDIASAQNAVLYCERDARITLHKDDIDGICFDIKTALYHYDGLTLSLCGAYQPRNAATTVLAVQALRDSGLRITDEDMRKGLAKAVWPGRMEIIGREPLFVLDGAHNREAAALLAETVRKYFAGRHVTAIVGVLRGKEYEYIVNTVTESADAVVLTSPAYAVRALPPSELFVALRNKNRLVLTESDYRRALAVALRITPVGGVVLCAGSLYLVGDVRGCARECGIGLEDGI